MPYARVTLTERPDLLDRIKDLEGDSFPIYITHGDRAWDSCWPHMITDFADYQIFLFDEEGSLIGIANSVPFHWDGSADDLPGFQEVLLRSVRELKAGESPNTLHPLQVMTAPAFRGKGLAQALRGALSDLAHERGLGEVLNIRPNLKHRYPITPLAEYATWKQADGQPFDPWVRTLARSGLEFVRVADDSTVIRENVAQWESWVEMALPASGSYIIPGGLSPLEVNLETDEGRYSEGHLLYRVVPSKGGSDVDA